MARQGPLGPRQLRGFSLVELIVTVAIMAILMGLAVPNFREFIQNRRLAGATGDLLTALHVARTEALKRGEPILLCRTGDASADPASLACRAAEPDGDANQSRDWSPGWILYAKPGYTGSGGTGGDYSHATDGDPIAVGDPAPAGVTIRADQDADKWLAFFADGTLNESGPVTFVVCDDRGTGFGRQIMIPLMGRPYLEDPVTCTP